MNLRRAFQDWRIGAVFGLMLLVLAWTLQGKNALIGLALGLVATSISVVFLWLAVQQVGKLAETGAKGYRGGVIAGLGLLIKLPLFALLWMVGQQVGGVAPTWFLIGLGVVYFALVGWAQTRA